MKNLCTVEELEIVEIEIDEEIEKKNLKDFISTSLKLKNINLPKNKKRFQIFSFNFAGYARTMTKFGDTVQQYQVGSLTFRTIS